MARLGLKLEEELAQLDADKALDARLARRWAAQECARDRDQWQPLRSMPEPDPDRDSPDGAGRALEFEDIDDFVFSLGVSKQHFFISQPHSVPREPQLLCLQNTEMGHMDGIILEWEVRVGITLHDGIELCAKGGVDTLGMLGSTVMRHMWLVLRR